MSADLALQGLLFELFGALTAALNAVTGPTYEGLLVPSLDPGALYPPLVTGAGFFATAVPFSDYLVLRLVDPAIPLVAVAIGLLYLARTVVPRLVQRTEAILPKFVVAVLLANFSLPVCDAILGLAGAGYPVVASFDGGAWRSWTNLAGPGFLAFSWDNGALAFVLSFVAFSLVFLLVAALAVRDALLAVLVVLLPLLTLLYPVPALSGLARRGWMLFGQLAFLPWVVVVPLELAVGVDSPTLLIGFLTVALAAPSLLVVYGSSLTAFGLPSAASALNHGVQRGLGLGTTGAAAAFSPALGGPAMGAATAVRGAVRGAASAPMPAALPMLTSGLAGHAGNALFRHLHGAAARPGRFPAVHAAPPGRRGSP